MGLKVLKLLCQGFYDQTFCYLLDLWFLQLFFKHTSKYVHYYIQSFV